MVVIQWQGGDNINTVPSGSRIGFFGENFGESIPLDNYQEKTIVTNATGTSNDGELPNVKFVNTLQGLWSGSSTAQSMALLPSGSATLHISLTTGSNTRLQAVRLIAYSGSLSPSGSVEDFGPKNMNVMGYEVGGLKSTWTFMSGSAAPLVLTPHTGSAQLTHNYYIALSASPTVTGVNTVVALALYAEWY